MVRTKKTKNKIGRNKSTTLKRGRPPLKPNNLGTATTISTLPNTPSDPNSHIKSTSKIQSKSHNAITPVNPRHKSSKATRTLITVHHQLQKSRSAALKLGDHDLVADLDGQIARLGGLEAYQAASLTGQDRDRGGDSSEKLVEWLRGYGLVGSVGTSRADGKHNGGNGLRVLEVGALSSRNVISSMIGRGIELVKRVDLHSQEPEHIQEIDFMELPLPTSEDERFDVVSLSLVLNYVPSVVVRGEMLRRTTMFLRRAGRGGANEVAGGGEGGLMREKEGEGERAKGEDNRKLPCLFVVLPLSCLINSRYMTHDHFVEMLASLGYILIKDHESRKLSYMLFRWDGKGLDGEGNRKDEGKGRRGFKKVELRPGGKRNNFAVVLEAEQGIESRRE